MRAAQMPLGPDDAVPGQLAAQAVALPSGTYFLSLGVSHRLLPGAALQGMDSGL
ncbi:hypothetical protein D3C79_607260 [compost metagenome]